VLDEGEGIPENEVETIFDEFAQSKKVKSGSFVKGTGLGLAICKEIVHAHGGEIWAENRAEGGARLTFTLPLHPEHVIAKGR
jgi:two-component system, OmpR family, sensor histidine kinase KdpD